MFLPSPPVTMGPTPTGAAQIPSAHGPESLEKAAQDLEAVFLAEMLKSAGYGKARGAFGGGSGESQFSSFLVSEHAKAMSKAGGVGLARQFMAAMQTQMEQDNAG